MRLEFETEIAALPAVENEVVNEVALPASPEFELLMKNGVAAAQHGDRDHARSLLINATNINPGSEEAWMWLASISDYPEELLAFLNNVLGINPDNNRAAEWRAATRSLLAKTFFQRAILAHERGDERLANQCIEQSLEHDIKCEQAWLLKAAISEDVDHKFESLSKALEINPENQEAARAVEAIKTARSQAGFNQAKQAAAAGDRAKAVQVVDEFLQNFPASSEAWILRSHLSESVTEKIAALQKALQFDPENAAAKSGLAFLSLTFGSQDENAAVQPQPLPETHRENGPHNSEPVQAEEQKISDSGGMDAVSETSASGIVTPENTESNETSVATALVTNSGEHRAGENEVEGYDSTAESYSEQKASEFEESYVVLDDAASSDIISDVHQPNDPAENILDPVGNQTAASSHETASSEAAPQQLSGPSDPAEFAPSEVPREVPATNGVEPRHPDASPFSSIIADSPDAQEKLAFASQPTAESIQIELSSHDETLELDADDYDPWKTRVGNIDSWLEEEIKAPVQTDVSDAATSPAGEYTETPQVEAAKPQGAEYFPLIVAETPKPEPLYLDQDDQIDVKKIAANGPFEQFTDDSAEPSEPEDSQLTVSCSFCTELNDPAADRCFACLAPMASFSGPVEAISDETSVGSAYSVETSDAPFAGVACPFCSESNEMQSFECSSCHATLTLSDIESLLSNSHANREVVQQAVTRMEAEWNLREFDEIELTALAIGHFNLGNSDAGYKYLQEVSRLDPNNVILSGQINTIAIRLGEMRRQDEVSETKPKGKMILVVDDSPTVRKLIAGKLEKSGHNVVSAVDGVDALARLSEAIPDLILLDIAMPRMDGYEVCKQIRANPVAKDLPVVMISGKDGFFDKVRGRMAGCTGYVTKPFGPETLMKALETYLLPDDVESN